MGLREPRAGNRSFGTRVAQLSDNPQNSPQKTAKRRPTAQTLSDRNWLCHSVVGRRFSVARVRDSETSSAHPSPPAPLPRRGEGGRVRVTPLPANAPTLALFPPRPLRESGWG